MLLIVLGIVITIFTIVRVVKTNVDLEVVVRFSIIHGLLLSFGIAIIVIGVGVPMHGYYEPIVAEEYRLEEIIEDTGIYVIETPNGIPFFSYVDSSYETGKFSPYNDSDLEIIVSDKYEKPTLVKYQIKPRKGVLSLGLYGYRTEYKIYVAEENIKRLK